MVSRFRAQSGFTLIEALVAILVGVIALLGLYQLVDASNKLTKQQTEVADVQQSARIGVSELSRIIRQSRVGGLYFGNTVLPIANNSPGGASLVDNSVSPQSHFIRKGTDVIEVRGVLLGDRYILDEGNVTCAVPANCANGTITVTIPSRAALGFVNFPTGQAPSLASRSGSFYFAVQNGENQVVTVGGSSYLVPVYIAGLVTAAGGPCLTGPTWCTLTATSLTFTMNPTGSGPKELNATTPPPTTTLSKSIAGGAVDVVRFFVDEGGTNQTGIGADTHPSLAEAVLDPTLGGPTTGGKWNIQPLVEEVEDFQIAYGVDAIDGTPHDDGVSPVVVDESGANKDEWVGNVAGEVGTYLPISAADANHSGVDAFIDSSIPAGPTNPVPAVPALRSVWISLVVKSTNPELVYDGPGARGLRILDSTIVSFSAATGRPYRRRPLSLAVSLRNNALFNRPVPTPTP
jgi:prepilin-type N-terminal cleavage/methylation domain-containing protein